MTHRAPAPVGLADLRAWRRTGLVLGWAGVACAAAAQVTRLAAGRGGDAAVGVLLLVALAAVTGTLVLAARWRPGGQL